MMPFFFTMPIRRMIPMIAMTERSRRAKVSASSAPTPADGRSTGLSAMDVTFVEDAEDDIHDHQGGADQ